MNNQNVVVYVKLILPDSLIMKRYSYNKRLQNDLEENNPALFTGTGMSKSAGYGSCPEPLMDIALLNITNGNIYNSYSPDIISQTITL